jgi:hypothetical protein
MRLPGSVGCGEPPDALRIEKGALLFGKHDFFQIVRQFVDERIGSPYSDSAVRHSPFVVHHSPFVHLHFTLCALRSLLSSIHIHRNRQRRAAPLGQIIGVARL